MAWNQSASGNSAARKPSLSAPFWLKGAIAGLVVVAALGVVVFLIFGGDDTKPNVSLIEKKTGVLETVQHHVSTNRVDDQKDPKAPLTKEEVRLAMLKKIRDQYGDNIPSNLIPTVYYLENPPQRTIHQPKTRSSIFKYRSEREIAALLLVQPGSFFMRRPVFGDRFDNDLKLAMNEKIEISGSDSAEDRELKEAVSEVKKEFADRMNKGEKPSEIMANEADSLYALGQYRRNLESELIKLRQNENYTDDDLRDYVTAANQMLEQKGLPPMRSPNFTYRQVSIAMAAERRKKQAEQTKEK